MRIEFVPQLSDRALEYEVNGDTLTVHDGTLSESWDFSGLPDGRASAIEADILPTCPLIAARKEGGEVIVKVLEWYTNPSAPPEPREETYPWGA